MPLIRLRRHRKCRITYQRSVVYLKKPPWFRSRVNQSRRNDTRGDLSTSYIRSVKTPPIVELVNSIRRHANAISYFMPASKPRDEPEPQERAAFPQACSLLAAGCVTDSIITG